MKNHDLFGCVLIDSKEMDLRKQEIRLAKNILCHLGKVKLTDLLQSTEALARSCHSISFIHEVNGLGAVTSLNLNCVLSQDS